MSWNQSLAKPTYLISLAIPAITVVQKMREKDTVTAHVSKNVIRVLLQERDTIMSIN